MHAAGGKNSDHVEVRLIQELHNMLEGGHPELAAINLGALGNNVAYRAKACSRYLALAQQVHVAFGDTAASEYSHVNHIAAPMCNEPIFGASQAGLSRPIE
jgi:hypothetical protein